MVVLGVAVDEQSVTVFHVHTVCLIKHRVRLKKFGPWKNVKEFVLTSVKCKIFSLDNKVTA